MDTINPLRQNKKKIYKTDRETGEQTLIGAPGTFEFITRQEDSQGNAYKLSALTAEELRDRYGTYGFPWLRDDVGVAGRITGKHAGPALDPIRGSKQSNKDIKGQPQAIDTRELQEKKVEPVEDDLYLDDLDDEQVDPWTPPPTYKNYEDWKEGETGYFHDQFSHPSQTPLPSNRFLSINDFQPSDVNIELDHLDIERDIMDDFTVVLIGRRRSGKSFMSRWIMYHLRHRFPAGIVITGTRLNNFWAKHVPTEYIHDVNNLNAVIQMVFQRQTLILEHPELGIDPRFFVILDDVLQDKYRLRFSKQLSKIFTDGRHYNLFTLITTQDPKGIPPELRENTDCCVIFRQFNKGRKESVIEDFVDYIDNKKLALEFLWNHTGRIDPNTNKKIIETDDTRESENGIPEALICLQARVTENLFSIFKRCVAEDPGDFFLGDVNYWKAQQKGTWNKVSNESV